MSNSFSLDDIKKYEIATITDEVKTDQARTLFRVLHGTIIHTHGLYFDNLEGFDNLYDLEKAKLIATEKRQQLVSGCKFIEEMLCPPYFQKRMPEYMPSKEDTHFIFSAMYHLLADKPHLEQNGGSPLIGGRFSRQVFAECLKALGLGEPLSAEQIFNTEFSKRVEQVYNMQLAHDQAAKSRISIQN